MDVTGLAAAFVGAATAKVQMAAAAKMMKMNVDAQGAIVKVLEAAQENAQKLAATAAGLGGNIDISV